MKYFLDVEFDGRKGDIISLALLTENDKDYLYLIASDVEVTVPWVQDNVVPILKDIGDYFYNECRQLDFGPMLRNFLKNDDDIVIIADSPVDIGWFCSTYMTGIDGNWMSNKKRRMSLFVENVETYPNNLEGCIRHNALHDARALRHALNN